jgi:hypothetical protein
MKTDNTAVIYQHHKSIGMFYRSREFAYLRFVMARANDR